MTTGLSPENVGAATLSARGTTTYDYSYIDGQLWYMKAGSQELFISWDANGNPWTLQTGGQTYYYVTNLQGDVTAILNGSGDPMVTYTYDAWGNILTIGGDDANTLGRMNPLRYRGYVYDQETGLYYLQSRYYDPEMGRFISADPAYIATGQGLVGNNMFAYCNNNPVAFFDKSGEFPWLAVGIIAVCAIGGGFWGYTRNRKLGPKTDERESPIDSTPLPPTQNNPYEGQTESGATNQHTRDELSLKDRLNNTLIGVGLGAASGGGITILVGMVGTATVGAATTYIAAFGGTGAQTFSIGALAYNFFAMVVAPFFGVEMETIEIEP